MDTNIANILRAAFEAAAQALGLNAADKVRALADVALDYLPLADLHGHIDAAAQRRADAVAEAAELAKFPPL